MTEYGIFSDEGILAGGFYSTQEATNFAARQGYEDVTIEEVCHDHPEHARVSCEECNTEEDPS